MIASRPGGGDLNVYCIVYSHHASCGTTCKYQPQQPTQHSGGWGPSRDSCFRCGQHGHLLSGCRAVSLTPNTRLSDPYPGAQAAIAGTAVDTGVAVADAWTALAGATADTAVAAADIADNAEQRRTTFTAACRVRRHCGLHVPSSPALATASGFKTSGQGMAAVGPVQAPVEIFHMDEATLQVTQTETCSNAKFLFSEA